LSASRDRAGGDAEWLALAYEVLPGNTADSKTLPMFLCKIQQQYGKARRVWVTEAVQDALVKGGIEFLDADQKARR